MGAALLTSTAQGAVPPSAYPVKVIRLIVPFPPGASNDVIARVIGQRLNEALGQPVITDNRGGAGSAIGSNLVAKSAPDGYTLMLTSSSYSTNAALQPRLPFDPIVDITGVAMIGTGPLLLVVNPLVPAKSARELFALTKAQSQQLNYASSGNGSLPHLATAALLHEAGIFMTHVPYKGLGPAVNDLMGGQVQVLLASLPSVLPQAKAGRLRALAVSARKRSQFVPDMPTIAESGVPSYTAEQWWGMFAPASTPGEIIAKLNSAIAKILLTDEMKERLANEGAEPATASARDFTGFVKGDIARWSKVVKDANIKAE
jgi:tripartite-type tricarboxylate transporter receptor subunit TctC